MHNGVKLCFFFWTYEGPILECYLSGTGRPGGDKKYKKKRDFVRSIEFIQINLWSYPTGDLLKTNGIPTGILECV